MPGFSRFPAGGARRLARHFRVMDRATPRGSGARNPAGGARRSWANGAQHNPAVRVVPCRGAVVRVTRRAEPSGSGPGNSA